MTTTATTPKVTTHRDGTVTEDGVLIGTVGRSWRTSYKAGVWVASGFTLLGKTRDLGGSWVTRAEAVEALVKHHHRYDAVDAALEERRAARRLERQQAAQA